MTRLMFASALICLCSLVTDGQGFAAMSFDCSHAALSSIPTKTLHIKRNEIYARRGMIFKDAALKRHFSAQPWYRADKNFVLAAVPFEESDCAQKMKLWESADKVLWRTSADLDGDRKDEKIFLVRRKRSPKAGASRYQADLLINEQAVQVNLYRKEGDYFYDEMKDPFKIVDIDPKDVHKEVWLKSYYSGDEDPGIENTFVSFIGERALKSTIGGATNNLDQLESTKNGEVIIVNSHCPSSKTWYRLKDGLLVKLRTKTGKAPPEGCPACPFVYVLDDGAWKLQGEILRNLNHSSKEQWQELRLRTTSFKGQLTLRVVEEKDERTFVDKIGVLADGVFHLPQVCTDLASEICSEDGVYLTLDRGESVTLEFRFPPETQELVLFAKGYYLPLNN